MNKMVMRHLREPVACKLCPLRAQGRFEPLSAAELSFIQKLKAGEAALPAGTRVKQEGVADGDCYTLLAGWAFRFRTLSGGARQILNFLLPGDLIGLPESLGMTAPDGVELLTDGVLCRFPAKRLTEVCEKQPRLGSYVTWFAAHGEAVLAENLVSVGQRTAAQRVATLLVDLYRRADFVGLKDAAGAIEFPLTQQHMADALGMSLVHTHRTLRALARKGLFTLAGFQLTIPEPAALRAAAEYQGHFGTHRPLL